MVNKSLPSNSLRRGQGRSRGPFATGRSDSDILWRNDNGTVLTWEMNGFGFVRTHNFGVVSNAWRINGVGDFDLA
jgi:hypothetical protein